MCTGRQGQGLPGKDTVSSFHRAELALLALPGRGCLRRPQADLGSWPASARFVGRCCSLLLLRSARCSGRGPSTLAPREGRTGAGVLRGGRDAGCSERMRACRSVLTCDIGACYGTFETSWGGSEDVLGRRSGERPDCRSHWCLREVLWDVLTNS